MRTMLSLLLTAGLTGCAWPVLPTFDRKAQANGKKVVYALDHYEARSLLANWEGAIESAANDRRTAELVVGELTFYGTLVFTAAMAQIAHAGGTAEVSRSVLRARNLGAFAAGGSQLLGSHYKWAEQRVAFTKAADRLKCGRQAIAPLNPAVREGLISNGYISSVNAALQAAGSETTFEQLWLRVPEETAHFVENQVNPDLRASLQAIALSTPSRAEFSAIFDSWQKASQMGAKAASTARDTSNPSVLSFYRTRRASLAVVRAAEPETQRANQQRKEDLAAISGRSEVELEDMRRAFVAALIEYSSALALCK